MKKQSHSFSKGFTLIELLVVIAIIGILASIVISSLSKARLKSRDVSAIGSVSSIRNQAGLYLNDNTSYTGLCANAGVDKLIVAAEAKAGDATCLTNGTSYATKLEFVADTTQDFCVDDTGFAGKRPHPIDITDFNCD